MVLNPDERQESERNKLAGQRHPSKRGCRLVGLLRAIRLQ
jgi:hypothetical protein